MSKWKLLYVLYIHVTVIVRDFFLNNQPDALIIQIYSVIKESQDGILNLLGSGHQNLHET
jgi:hypothetical protein